mmetsp:Transcript_30716/g.78236  ORF Transcript_30716/g.78236 Transcript_30716/m.78236 type:complete len:230 (-) Transcript_30716:809-1498(-)
MVHTGHVADCLLKRFQFDADAAHLDLPVRAAVVVEAARSILRDQVTRAVQTAKPRHVHELAVRLRLVIEVAAGHADASCVQHSSLTDRAWPECLCVQHDVPVRGHVMADGDVIPGPHLNHHAIDRHLRGAVSVEEAATWRPGVKNVTPQRLPTNVESPQVRQSSGRDVGACDGHRPQVRRSGHQLVDSLAVEPAQHVGTGALHDVSDNNARALLVQSSEDLRDMVVEGH